MSQNTIPKATYEIWLDDQFGNRVDQITQTGGFEYTRKTNDPGWLTLQLPGNYDPKKIFFPDSIVEIWRSLQPGAMRLEGAFFLRTRKRWSEKGNRFLSVAGPGVAELIKRRIIAYKSESTQATMTDNADDMCKAIFVDNLGSDAVAGRDLTSVGGGVTVEKDLALADSISKGFSFKPMSQVLEEIASTSRYNGDPLYYDLVPFVTDDGKLRFQFRTWVGARGTDRRLSGLVFGEQWANLQDPAIEEYYDEEINYAYIGGEGEGPDRNVREVSDATRIAMSAWNRREAFKDARNSGSDAAMDAEGKEMLNQGRPRVYFSGTIVESENCRYQRDWDFGDVVIAEDNGLQFDCKIDQVTVKVGGDGQDSISSKLEYEGLLTGTGIGGAT